MLGIFTRSKKFKYNLNSYSCINLHRTLNELHDLVFVYKIYSCSVSVTIMHFYLVWAHLIIIYNVNGGCLDCCSQFNKSSMEAPLLLQSKDCQYSCNSINLLSSHLFSRACNLGINKYPKNRNHVQVWFQFFLPRSAFKNYCFPIFSVTITLVILKLYCFMQRKIECILR